MVEETNPLYLQFYREAIEKGVPEDRARKVAEFKLRSKLGKFAISNPVMYQEIYEGRIKLGYNDEQARRYTALELEKRLNSRESKTDFDKGRSARRGIIAERVRRIGVD